MVKTLLSLVLSIVLLACQAAGTDSVARDGIEPELKRLRLPPTAELTIDENGAKSSAAKDSPEECSAFMLSKHDVKEYFSRAGEVTQHDYAHMLDWSPCYASGKVVFSDGLTGTWGIQQMRAGSLILSDGRIIYLYCPTCDAKAFSGQ